MENKNPFLDATFVSNVKLEAERLTSEILIDNEVLSRSNVSLSTILKHEINAMAVRMTAHVASQVLVDREVKYPATWFQHFKKAWFPAFLLSKYPVQYTTVRLVAKALYPDIALPDQRSVIVTSITPINMMDIYGYGED
jgi:hypothetical protein